MSAPKATGDSLAIAKLAIGCGELRVLLYPRPRATIDLRWFEPGGGPAAVPMPTKDGISVPIEDVGDLIEGLKQAEMRFRLDRLAVAS